MTNINCTCNCIYQKDGKCSFDQISSKMFTPQIDCPYFFDGKPIQKNT